MKKLILAVIIIFISCLSFAQTTVIRTEYVAVQFGEDYNFKEWGEWEETNLLITFNYTNEVIKIDNKFQDIFYIRNYTEKTKGHEDGDSYEKFVLTCYDKDGKTCYVTCKIYDDNTQHIIITYSDIRYVYQGRKI